mgnify:CR=1 FL=1
MSLIGKVATLPVAGPLGGALWLARKIHEAAERERRDPAAIRAALAALERRLEAGEIDEDAFEAAEERLLDLLEAAGRAP